ncbi:Predicted DNA-binding protein, MmcQ/YjbR family [Devosia lucknowensis]|uniref:Predicted DNA-binding protein, MmcQ/YjbR family n=1 Tax=Devosia lucknowensis TaxID=1096929 RepID=A0A1Y6GEU3_9HYPH|nr:MmcQ/YjbR family DNA-binding protein [Devosia lucknowensis]SMQ86340.1 Predicted DNA-binding protein, MmcQ/YjbR family [Devosia lucknowensis]
MSVSTRSGFDAALGALGGVTFVDQWEARVAKVGGKVFCLLSDAAPHRMTLKCGENSFDILTALEGIDQAPYFAKRQWVSVTPGALPDDDLLAYAARSHAIVAAGLTKKLRTELGIA